jgi:hypothetical protein
MSRLMGPMRQILFGAALAAACGPGPNVETGRTGGAPGGQGTGGTTGGQGTGGSTGGSPGIPPSITPVTPPGGTVPPPGGAPGGGSDVPTCGAEMVKAIPLPVDIFILQDRSQSMTMPAMAGGTLSKWDAVRQALTSFLQSPAASGLGVGLGFFPPTAGNACTPATYAIPAVGISALPPASTSLITTLNAQIPGGNTPTKPALDGAILYARAWEMTMTRRVAIALATDGEPNQCNSTVPAVSASAAAAAATGIFTFVVGVGPSLQNLDAIAQAGGTKMAYLVDTAGVDQLIAAFKSIQQQAAKLACSFAIPPSPTGQMLDPNAVNVRFTATGNPANAVTLGQVPGGRSQCGPMGGWYLDNPTAPTSISLCDASCQQVNTAPDGVISLVFGCKSIVIP